MSNIREEAKKLREMWSSFRQARVLITANNYMVFDLLTKPQTAKTISQKLKIDLRATEILLDALTGIGLLKKSAHTYKNSPISNRFLIKDSRYYQGDIIRHADSLWKNWSALDEDYREVFEPFSSPPNKRVSLIRDLIKEGIKTSVRVDPLVPPVTDSGTSYLNISPVSLYHRIRSR
jgi:hypothetical protein